MSLDLDFEKEDIVSRLRTLADDVSGDSYKFELAYKNFVEASLLQMNGDDRKEFLRRATGNDKVFFRACCRCLLDAGKTEAEIANAIRLIFSH